MAKKLLYPDELQEGIRVQFKDRNEATRQGRIVARQGNKITIEAALKVRMRVPAENIGGYWVPKVKASPKNLIKLRGDRNKINGIEGKKSERIPIINEIPKVDYSDPTKFSSSIRRVLGI